MNLAFMKVKTQTVSKVLREYKYCTHVHTVLADMHVSSCMPAITRSLEPLHHTSYSPPLSAPHCHVLKPEPNPEQSQPTSSCVLRFPPATSPADRRACYVGCFAKMIDSFINNCS